MCRYLILFIFSFLSFSNILSAKSDTLIIKIKDGTEKIFPLKNIMNMKFEEISDVENIQDIEYNLQLKGNHPNPASDKTVISFDIKKQSDVLIKIYNNSGKLIKEIERGNCQQGENKILWDCIDNNGSEVLNGIYFYEVIIENHIQSNKIIILK